MFWYNLLCTGRLSVTRRRPVSTGAGEPTQRGTSGSTTASCSGRRPPVGRSTAGSPAPGSASTPVTTMITYLSRMATVQGIIKYFSLQSHHQTVRHVRLRSRRETWRQWAEGHWWGRRSEDHCREIRQKWWRGPELEGIQWIYPEDSGRNQGLIDITIYYLRDKIDVADWSNAIETDVSEVLGNWRYCSEQNTENIDNI